MQYYLTDEPRSGTLLAGAFDAIDQVYGTAPFTDEQAVKAITTVISVGTLEATSLFKDLVGKGYITASTPGLSPD